MSVVTLTTDFGSRDWFVGTMKGVVLGINPRANIVDLTHEIPPGDIRAGAFALMAGYRYFPKGTVHGAVIDPGVGSQRRAIVVHTTDYFFVGPDNGVLSWALAHEKIKTIRQLENPKYFFKPISRTFHGRDIFAPVAAHLSRGLPLKPFGRELKNFVQLPWPKLTQERGVIRGEIVYVDHFGNAITNIEAELLAGGRKTVCEAIGKRKVRCDLLEFYGEVPANSPVALIGSNGFLEIAVNSGSATLQFGLKIGNTVIVRQTRAR